MLRHQTVTLFVTLGTLILTLYMYVVVPKGFFPVQDTGVILGISQAPETTSFEGMGEKQRVACASHSAGSGCAEPFFVYRRGWTNMTPNSGRIRINIKPRDERSASSPRSLRFPGQGGQCAGHHVVHAACAGPTVEDRVSRTQYQYTLEEMRTDLDDW